MVVAPALLMMMVAPETETGVVKSVDDAWQAALIGR
jgi:hypothetical protein